MLSLKLRCVRPVRGSLTNDGRPPLDASGLKLQERLSLIEASLERVAKRGCQTLDKAQTNCEQRT
jgi:hypothetical protein